MEAQRIPCSFLVIISIVLCSCVDEDLPTINIIKAGGIGWGEKEECTVIYSTAYDSVVLPASIKARGGISSRYDKHSFTLELKEKYPLGNLPSNDDWILNANYIDKTFMRHKISFDLFHQMGQRNLAPKCAYLNLTVNHQPFGLYVLMEEVNASLVGLDKSDPAACLFKDPPVFYKERLAYVKDTANYYGQKYPKIHEADRTPFIEEFRELMFNAPDKLFADQIRDWVALDNIADWHILLLLTNNSDGLMKNFFLYKVDKKSPFRFAIWDYDHSFGRDGDNEINMLERQIDCRKVVLIDRLMKTPEIGYLPILKDRWNEHRENEVISEENIKRLIGENDEVIKQGIVENSKVWPYDAKWYYDNNSYEDEIGVMDTFVSLRITQLDKYFMHL